VVSVTDPYDCILDFLDRNLEVARSTNTTRMQDLEFVLQVRSSLLAHESESMQGTYLVCREKREREGET
jgi:hypothetical protein